MNCRCSRLLTSVIIAIAISTGWLCVMVSAETTRSSHVTVSLTHQRVLILGDSITQDGRYVSYLEYYLHVLSPGETADIISIGLSSETVSGLSEKGHPYPRPCALERLDRALKLVKPQVVVACYGMNDGIYHPPSVERLATFNHGLSQFIAQVRATGAALILLTPPVFDASPIRKRTVAKSAEEFGYDKPYEGYDGVLGEFAQAELAIHETGVTVIDLHGAYLSALAKGRVTDPTFTFAPDGVHPNDEGHRLMARTLMQALGYDLPADSVSKIQSDPVFSVIRDQRQLRSEAWLPFVGYVRGETFKSASVTAAEAVIVRLQNEIDVLTAK